jgi:hypothetical protein
MFSGRTADTRKAGIVYSNTQEAASLIPNKEFHGQAEACYKRISVAEDFRI